MSKNFKHPLARASKIWTASSIGGEERKLLVIVTTLELNPKHRGFNGKLVEKLSQAAKEYLTQNEPIKDFVLVNRPKDWED